MRILQTASSFVACGKVVMSALHCMSHGAYMLLHGFVEHGSNAGACTACPHHQHLLLADLLPLFALHCHSSIHTSQGYSCCPLLAPFPLSGSKVHYRSSFCQGQFGPFVCWRHRGDQSTGQLQNAPGTVSKATSSCSTGSTMPT